MYGIPAQYQRPLGIGAIVIALVIIYFIAKKNDKLCKIFNICGSEEGADQVKVNQSNVRAGFNAKNQAVALATYFSNAYDGGGEDIKALDILLEMSDDELKAVHNAWVEHYKGGKFWSGIKDTLRKQVNAEVIAIWRSDAKDKKKRVLARLDKLNL